MSVNWLPELSWLENDIAWLWPANVALAALFACLVGLLAGRLLRGRPVPVRHGLLLATVGLTLVCPLAMTVSSWLGLGVFSIPVTESADADAIVVAPHVEELGPPMKFSEHDESVLPASKELSEVDQAVPDEDEMPVGLPQQFSLRQAEPDLRKVPGFKEIVPITLIAAWLVGVMWCVARLGRGLVLLRRLRGTLSPVEDVRVASAGRAALEAAGVSPETKLLESAHAPLPLTLGLFRPVVVLPIGLGVELEDDELFCVLVHEAAHIRRRDQWVGLAQRLASAAFWWNPLLHRINRNIARLREHICDDCVVAAHGDGRPLATALVKVAECWSAPAVPLPAASTLVDEVEELSERINRLFNQERAMTIRLNGKAMNLVLAFSLLLSAVLFFPTLRPASAQEKEKSQTPATESADAKSKSEEGDAGGGLRITIPAQGPAPLALDFTQPVEGKKTRGDKTNAKAQKKRESIGQRYALEYATTILIFFDTNQDAHLSREEARKAAWPHAERVWFHGDRNGDNRVSRQELKDEYLALFRRVEQRDGQAGQTHSFAERNWARSDTNKDGRVDRREARNSEWLPAEQIWFRGDLDKDDKLTVNEMRVHYAVGALDKSIRLRAAARPSGVGAALAAFDAALRVPGAQQPAAGPNPGIRVRSVETMILSRFDIDRDGTLGPVEIRKMPWPRSEETFQHCDLNRDGKVTISELSDTLDLVYRRNSRQRLDMPDRFGVSNWKELDTNRDGIIDHAERRKRPHPHIEAWFLSDLDGDGKMTLSEMNLAFNYIALDKSIRMKEAVEKKHAPAKLPTSNGDVTDTLNTAALYAELILKRFDGNNDGRIDRAEARKAPWPKSEQVWFQGSRQRDEWIDAAELRAQFEILQGVLKKSGQQDSHSHTNWLLKVVDRNGDRQIDKAETRLTSWPDAGGNWFKGDANGDGKVGYEELLVAMAMNAQDKGVRLAEAELRRLNSGRKAQP